MQEKWKSINGFPNYEVSNFGQVRNIKSGRMISQSKQKDGYIHVRLCDNGQKKYFGVHRLVALAFCQDYFEGAAVNHLDENKANNNAENLKWVTYSQNARYGTRIDRIREKQLNHPNESKSVIATSITGETYIYPSTKEAERQTGIFHNNISRAACGKNKTAGGYTWRYYEREENYNG